VDSWTASNPDGSRVDTNALWQIVEDMEPGSRLSDAFRFSPDMNIESSPMFVPVDSLVPSNGSRQ
jgi:hypothetical protein